MKFIRVMSEYRWPIFLASLLFMCVCACGTIVFVATRPDAPRPIRGYYDAARKWDASKAVEEASRQLGWTVRYEFPADVPHFAGMPRPIDVTVADRNGRPVSGLAGNLFAIRPSDTRLNQSGRMTELPQQPGSYRTLLMMDTPGAWELRIDVSHESLRFVHGSRVTVATDDEAVDRGSKDPRHTDDPRHTVGGGGR